MGARASQITSPTIVYSTVHSGADQRKHLSSASLVFVQGLHRWPVNSPHKWPITRKMFPFDDAIMRPILWGQQSDKFLDRLPLNTDVTVHYPVELFWLHAKWNNIFRDLPWHWDLKWHQCETITWKGSKKSKQDPVSIGYLGSRENNFSQWENTFM